MIPHVLFLSDFITENVCVTPLYPGDKRGKFKLNEDDEIYNLQSNFSPNCVMSMSEIFLIKQGEKYIIFCGGLDMVYIVMLKSVYSYHVNL